MKRLGIIGRKVGMTQIFEKIMSEEQEGMFYWRLTPVTVIEANPGTIVQVKTKDKEGFSAIKVGFFDTHKKLNKPDHGQFPKNLTPKRKLVEFRVDDETKFNVGDEITLDVLGEHEFVDIRGKTKGKGFQGVMKRHGFSGGPKSHGSQFHRRPGAIGQHSDPSHIWKGQKLPGHDGNVNRCIQNLKVVNIDKEKNLLIIKGSVPGHANCTLYITPSIKKIYQAQGKERRKAKAEGLI